MALHQVRPRILGFISEDVSAWLVASLVLLAGTVLTGLLTWAMMNLFNQQLRQRFELQAEERFSRIEEHFQDQEQRLDSLRRFFANSEGVSNTEFRGYADALLRRTRAFAWAPRVLRDERQSFEQHAQAEGATQFTIREADGDGGLRQASERDEYAPMLYIQSQASYGAPLGLDLLSEPLPRAALERARQRDGLVASQPLDLMGTDPVFARGVLLVAPVTRESASEPLGYVVAAISMRQLAGDGLPASSHDNLSMRVMDLSGENAEEALFESHNPPGRSDLSSTRLLRLADRDYRVELRPSRVFLATNHSSVTSMVILGGLLSLLLSALLYVLVSQRQRALKLVEQRTRELRAREQELRGTHGQLRGVLDAATQVAIIATDLRGVITTFNAGAEQMLGYPSCEVLQSMTLESLHVPRELQARAAQLGARFGKPIPACHAMLLEGGEQGGQQAREWTLVRRDGSHLTVNMLATPMLDDQGLWIGHLAICIDITERKRVYEALAARDLLLKKLSAHVPGGSTNSEWISTVASASSMPVTAFATSMNWNPMCWCRTPRRFSRAFTRWTARASALRFALRPTP